MSCLITPERDKQPTCGISFRGLLDPKSDFLQDLGVPLTVSDKFENRVFPIFLNTEGNTSNS